MDAENNSYICDSNNSIMRYMNISCIENTEIMVQWAYKNHEMASSVHVFDTALQTWA